MPVLRNSHPSFLRLRAEMLWQGHLAQRASPAARASRLRLGSLASPAPRLVPPHGPALRCSTGKSLTLPTASSKILGVRHFSGTRRDVDLAPATLRRLGTLALGVSALGMLLGVVYCLEVEPLSSRRRVMIFSEKWDFNRGVEREAYLLRTRGGERCAANDSRSRNILEVASNLLAVGKLQKLRNWRVYVIDDRKSKDVCVLLTSSRVSLEGSSVCSPLSERCLRTVPYSYTLGCCRSCV